MTRFSPSSGTASATVAITSILRNEGSSLSRARCGIVGFEQRLRELECDARAAEVLARVVAVGLVGIENGERLRQAHARPPAGDGR